MIRRFLQTIESDPELCRTVRHSVFLPPHEPRYRDLDPKLPSEIVTGLRRLGVEKLYRHQTTAIEAVRAGDNVVVVTPTASGKTLTYALPVLESLYRNSENSAMLMFPLKALEQDQKAKLIWWQEDLKKTLPFSVDVFDGDTPRSQRARIKQNPPNFLITNPDMLHQGILAYHAGWEKFFRRLKWIVIDELHAYRGVFGSHILQVFRRLSRLLHYHGVNPQFICLSATIANPLALAETLTGRTFTLVNESGAPQGGKHIVFMDTQTSMTGAVAKLLIRAVDAGLRTLVFTKARVATEIIHRIVSETRPDLSAKISSYRAGFLPEERREIEQRMAAGELLGVISTSALELGIDIGGLDLCILAGYPGSVMSLWQRAGRVGRRGDESAIILVAGADALDQYFLSHPDELLHREYEPALVNQANEDILRGHLPAAAAEIPLMRNDPYIDVDAHLHVIGSLEKEGLLVKSASGEHWFPGPSRPHSHIDLRNVGGTFDVVSLGAKKPMGSVSGNSVFRECHHGAIYLHRGEQYLVQELVFEKRKISVQPINATYYTMVRSDKQTEIIDDRVQKAVRSFVAHAGKVKVTETFHSYERRRLYSQELLSVESLDLPPQSYTTSSAWIEVPTAIGQILGREDLHFMGGIHAVEHAAISLIPLLALCDRNDVGGISFTRHPQLEGGAIFFYDGYPGGVGIAERVFECIDDLLERTLNMISQCPCSEGCPSCIQSPKCGAGNKPLDKQAAILALKMLLHGSEAASISSIAIGPREMLESAAETPWIPQAIPSDKRVVVFDLETQKSADEVGGWSEARQMRLAVAAVWDSLDNQIYVYDESRVSDLLAHLKSADLVIGFNSRRFDYEVLRGYTFENLNRLPTLDLLDVVHQSAGKRLKLDTLAQGTLGTAKSADGLQSLAWFKAGELERVKEYCIKDVEITRDVLLFALGNGYVIYQRKDAGAVRLPMRILIDEYFRSELPAENY